MLSRILVADDSEAIQKAIRLAFQGCDVTIYESTSYVETLNICKKCQPELIVVDACLTGTDGPGDFKNIAAVSGGVPMVLLEGSFQPVDREAFRALGLACFIKKPFDQGEFMELVNKRLSLQVAMGQPVYNEDPDAGLGTAQPLLPVEAAASRPKSTGKRGAESASLPPPPVPSNEDMFGPSDGSGIRNPPPPPEFDAARDAFSQAIESTFSSADFRAEPVYAGGDSHGAAAASETTNSFKSQGMQAFVKDEVKTLVKEAVEEYCRLYFKPLLKEFVTEELRKLAREQTRQMTET